MNPSDRLLKCGFATLFGWTNVGKSTLLNRILGTKLAITSPVIQTTRNRLMGICTGDDYQLAIYDTPGIHHPHGKLSDYMMRTAWNTLDSSDVLIWLTFPDLAAEKQYRIFKERFEAINSKIVIAINRIDTVSKESLLPLIQDFEALVHPKAIIPISALTGDNVAHLVSVIVSMLPSSQLMFPEDQLTDRPTRFFVSEMIREHIMSSTFQELPHVVMVDIEQYSDFPDRKFTEISATIYVEKESQKAILIGKNGGLLKEIGTRARSDIESFIGNHINLKLWIKVKKDWRNDPRYLESFGFREG